MRDFLIRSERPEDAPGIERTVSEAFETAKHTSGNEAAIVAELRHARALTLSLVAQAGEIGGHVAFSPVSVTSLVGHEVSGWFGLGPLAVQPSWQGCGVGSALVATGLNLLRERGAAGCVVFGDPAYYLRFGFQSDGKLLYPGAPADFFQQITFANETPQGTVRYHPAFG